jgi:Mlc titration factor MtfA (ptsG expression regulator)
MIFDWLENRRRRKILEDPFPAAWNGILEQNVAHWKFLGDDEQQQLRDLVQVFVEEKDWEGAGGLELDDEIRVTIAACACILLLGLEHLLFRNVKTIIVYRSTVVTPDSHTSQGGLHLSGPGVPIHGQAMLRGPVLLVWDAVRHGARHPQRGHNVVYHEFAHKLDMLDGWVDGAPPFATQEQHTRWVDVCTREYEALRERVERGKRGFIDDYGATNPGEFFAVITEFFFDEPVELKRRHPDLYAVLMESYRQDTAARVQRRGGSE